MPAASTTTGLKATKPVVAHSGCLRIVVGWRGDGLHGDFDPYDAEDAPLLSFDVFVVDDEGVSWALDGASHRSFVDARAGRQAWKALAARVAREVQAGPEDLPARLQRLSWKHTQEEISMRETGMTPAAVSFSDLKRAGYKLAPLW